MSDLKTILQGQDLTVGVIYQIDGVPTSISDYDSITLLLINNAKEVKKYKYPATEGYGLITLDTETVGSFTFDITRSESKNFDKGQLSADMVLVDSNGLSAPCIKVFCLVSESRTAKL